MTTITLTKTIDKRGLGYLFGTGTGTDSVTITAHIQEVAWNTRKTLIKTPFPSQTEGSTSGDVDFYFVDLKNIEEAVRIRGWLDDSIEANGTVTTSGNNTITETGKSWTVNQYIGYYVKYFRNNIVTGSYKTETKKIASNTSDTITIEGTWATNPWTTDPYEIIHPAWMKFWQLRAMCTAGERLDSFIFGDINFDGTHIMGGDPWNPPGAVLDEVGMIIGSDDTGSIQVPLSDVARINITMSLVIGDDMRRAN